MIISRILSFFHWSVIHVTTCGTWYGAWYAAQCSTMLSLLSSLLHFVWARGYHLIGVTLPFSYKFHCLKSGTEQENENRMHDSGECVATRMADQSAFKSIAMFIAYARNCLCLHFVTASRFSDVTEYGKKLVYIVACVWTNNCDKQRKTLLFGR